MFLTVYHHLNFQPFRIMLIYLSLLCDALEKHSKISEMYFVFVTYGVDIFQSWTSVQGLTKSPERC